MARIAQECVARIKDSTDIVEFIGRFLQLRRAGNAWKACCPFHNEKTPSFHVNPARQSFHCFGCGVGGDAVKFLMMFENLDYPTALRRIADMNGIPVIEEEENPEIARRRRLEGRVVEVNTLAAEYFHRQLCRNREADHARAYLKKRGFDIDIARAWQIGWAPVNFRDFERQAAAANMDARLLTEADLLKSGARGTYPAFRDRLMFPIHDVRGKVVGFSGRVLEGGPTPPEMLKRQGKYVNTAETVVFRKSNLLFGLHKATKAIGAANMTAVVCEGQLDVIACHEKAEVRNAVAGLGTAFTDNHAKMLRKYASRAILCYDGDNAGIKASEKTYRKLAQAGFEVSCANLPPGEDPDSLIQTQGAEALKQALAEARPYLEVRTAIELSQAQGDSNARAALIPRMADLAAEIQDANRRDVAIADLATRLNTGLENLRVTVDDIIRARKNAPDAARHSSPEEEYFSEEEEERDAKAGNERPSHRLSAIAIRLHPAIRGLLQLAATNAEAQHMLVERIEELQEPIRDLSGGPLLQRLLECLPTPGDEAAWQAYEATLPAEQAAALRDIPHNAVPIDKPAIFIDQACERAARDTVQARIDQLRSRLRSANLSPQEAWELMQETNELQKMLNG